MTKEVFIQGIQYLKAVYSNFEFDLTDELKLNAWFSILSAFYTKDDTFMVSIKKYCQNEKYPPYNPNYIIDADVNSRIKEDTMTGELCWNWIINKSRGYGYYSSNLEKAITKKIDKTKSKAFKDTYTEMETLVINLINSDFFNEQAVRKEFLERFKSHQYNLYKNSLSKNNLMIGYSSKESQELLSTNSDDIPHNKYKIGEKKYTKNNKIEYEITKISFDSSEEKYYYILEDNRKKELLVSEEQITQNFT